MEKNEDIATYLFARGFLKNTGLFATPKSTSSKSSASVSHSMSSATATATAVPEMYDEDSDFLGNSSLKIAYQDETLPTKTSKKLFDNGDITEHYVLEQRRNNNRGYCSLLIQGSAPLTMEFNLTETCTEPIKFACLPGTHRWMLYKDITTSNITVNADSFMSIISIDSSQKITCCVELVGPADVLSRHIKMYRVKMKYFMIPTMLCTSSTIIDV